MNADKHRCARANKSLSVFIRVYLWLIIVFVSFYSVSSYALSQISITADRIEYPQGNAQHFAFQLNLNKPQAQFQLSAALKPTAEKDWSQFNLNCDLIQNTVIHCERGSLKSTRFNLPFQLKINTLDLANFSKLDATLQLNNGSFSDEAGLHAAEKLNGLLSVAANKSDNVWRWQTTLDWQSGELFWQPFYIANGGHQLQAKGRWQDNLLSIDHALLQIKDVGGVNANGVWDIHDAQFQSLHASTPQLNLETAYPLLLKPLLQKTALADAEMSGLASVGLDMQHAELKSFALSLKDTSITDNKHKFAFYGLNAEIPWDYDAPQQLRLRYSHGALLNLPLGSTDIRATLDRYALTADEMRLPILDGALHLKNISAAYKNSQWFWHLAAKLEPISMRDFSTALHMTPMSGKASAEIPLVTYAADSLVTDGSLELNIFNGKATVNNLTMQTPLGIAPKLNADIALRNLDLGMLTNTYSFGAIEGRLDGDINNLELQNWKPVRFDAKLQNSPGNYPKKISQRAVENISALGGGGAAAAIQRSFLRFFKQFNYGKMGLSCRLRNDICEMGGVESTPHGYVIVKGSGIPAITVMGYNQTVGWSELLSRIKRVTEGNAKAVVN